MKNFNNDIYELILNYIHHPDDLQSYCLQNKYFYNLYKAKKNKISEHFLNKYKVHYKEPNNFIYKYNNVDIKDYQENGQWKYDSIFKLYMKNFYKTKINCNVLFITITSVPEYPNLQELYCSYRSINKFTRISKIRKIIL